MLKCMPHEGHRRVALQLRRFQANCDFFGYLHPIERLQQYDFSAFAVVLLACRRPCKERRGRLTHAPNNGCRFHHLFRGEQKVSIARSRHLTLGCTPHRQLWASFDSTCAEKSSCIRLRIVSAPIGNEARLRPSCHKLFHHPFLLLLTDYFFYFASHVLFFVNLRFLSLRTFVC